MRRGRDSNGQSTEWITAQVCLLFRWPQLFPWTSSRRARLGNAEGTMRCSSQRPSCTSSPRTPRATRSSLRSTRTSNPRARPPSNNEHAPLRKERILPRVEKVSSPSAATKTRCWSKHEQEEETRRTHRTSSDSRPAACSTRPRSTQPT